MDFISKLDMLMKEKGVNKHQLSEQSSIPYMTIVNFYNKGTENIKLSTLKKLSRYFNVSLDYISDDTVQNRKLTNQSECLNSCPPHYADLHPEYRAIVDATSESIYQLQLSKEQSVSMLDITPDNIIPFRLSDQPASAGHGFDLGPENFHDIYVKKGCLPHGAKFGVPVAGNSMEPKYHDGDILVVDGQPVDEGEIGVFTLNGDGYVKKLQCGKLVSLNPDYEPIELHEYDQFKHNGRVIGVLDPECIVER